MGRLNDMRRAVEEGRSIKPVGYGGRGFVPGAPQVPGVKKPSAKAAGLPRKCCGTEAGKNVPHKEGCPNHPATPHPKKPKKSSPGSRDKAEVGRWPAHSHIEADWTGEKWMLHVDPGDGQEEFKLEGTGIHVLLSKAGERLATPPAPARLAGPASGPSPDTGPVPPASAGPVRPNPDHQSD